MVEDGALPPGSPAVPDQADPPTSAPTPPAAYAAGSAPVAATRATTSSAPARPPVTPASRTGGVVTFAPREVPVRLVGAATRPHSRRALWLTVAACAAAAAALTPVVTHYLKPAPNLLATPASLAGFTRDVSPSATQTADYLRTAVAAGMSLEKPIGAVYTDGGGDAHSVIVVGGRAGAGSGSVDERLTALFALITDPTDGLTGLTVVPTGSFGGAEKCGVSTDSAKPAGGSIAPPATAAGGDMSVCAWADDSTVGLALFPNRTVAEASALIAKMRPGLETKP